MLTYILYGLFVLACVILIVVILLQPGKADAGALFSNTLSSTRMAKVNGTPAVPSSPGAIA